jgi:hypothetical protein
VPDDVRAVESDGCHSSFVRSSHVRRSSCTPPI